MSTSSSIYVGASHGVLGEEILGKKASVRRKKQMGMTEAPQGKLDLLVTLDFRMSTTCVYSDIVLPTATWYEKNDLNTSDMHPFIHPLTSAVDPAWEARIDWDIFKGIARKFSEVAPDELGVEKDVVLTPILHDTPAEIAQATGREGLEARRNRSDPGQDHAGKLPWSSATIPTSTSDLRLSGTADGEAGQWRQGDRLEYRARGGTARRAERPRHRGRPDPGHAEDRNGLSMLPRPFSCWRRKPTAKWRSRPGRALSKATGRDHTHLAMPKEDEKIRFRDVVAQPRKIISSPTWSGLESEKVCYNAGYTNVHERIPWRTLSGRQQLYQDHLWMRAFGEALCVYRPPIDQGRQAGDRLQTERQKQVVLNFITPHQKWGIHSTYTDNLLMLTLSRGGPIVWMSETDAPRPGSRTMTGWKPTTPTVLSWPGRLCPSA